MSSDLTLVVERTFWELRIEAADTRRTASEPDMDLARLADLDCLKEDDASCATSAGSDTEGGSAELSVLSWNGSDDETLPVAVPETTQVDSGKRRRRGCRAGARAQKVQSAELTEEMRTSLLVSNISRHASRDDVLQLLSAHGLRQACDFLYLPVDFRDALPCGYAFLNFVSHEWAQAAIHRLHGLVPGRAVGEKPLDLDWTKGNQGLDALVNRYRNSPVMQGDMPDEWRPLLFRHGCRIPFPAPNKKVKPVRNLEQKPSA